jgi:hypothetical protein
MALLVALLVGSSASFAVAIVFGIRSLHPMTTSTNYTIAQVCLALSSIGVIAFTSVAISLRFQGVEVGWTGFFGLIAGVIAMARFGLALLAGVRSRDHDPSLPRVGLGVGVSLLFALVNAALIVL